MKPQHVYQPVMIRALVDAGGSATLRQIALEFVKNDESELRSYEQKISRMPLKVLREHRVQQDLKDLRVTRAQLVRKAHKELLVRKALKATLD